MAKRDSRRRRRMGRTHAMLACCFAASAVLAGPASAGQIFRESFHDEGTFVAENFCGVSGLTVEESAVLDVTVQAVQRGPNGFAYFLEHHKETSVLTNLANGKPSLSFGEHSPRRT